MTSPPDILVEACVDSVESALAAARGGARRIELCAGLVEGGVTPSIGMIGRVWERVDLGIHLLVRPRGGDFLYDEDELALMRDDIAAAGDAGMDGVVLGALREDGRIDEPALAGLLAAARPMSVTFHRAFDLCRDPAAALDLLIAHGVDRVLTSGQAPTAEQGIPLLRTLVERAAGRIGILAGGGIAADNVARIVRETGVREVHVSARSARPSRMAFRRDGIPMGKPYAPDEYRRAETDPERIGEIVRRARGAS